MTNPQGEMGRTARSPETVNPVTGNIKGCNAVPAKKAEMLK